MPLLLWSNMGKREILNPRLFLTHERDNASQALNELARSDPGEYLRDYYYYSGTFQPPQDRIYCFAMTQTALEAYSSDYDPSILYADGYSTWADLVVLYMTFVGFVCAAALLLPFIKTLETGNEKIFSYPFEPVCLIALCVISVAVSITANPGTLDHQSIRSVLISIGLYEKAGHSDPIPVGTSGLGTDLCRVLLGSRLFPAYFHHGTEGIPP